jgi:hypothetical protein
MLKRHEVEILLKAGHSKAEVARLAEVSLRSVNRIAEEAPVVHVDDAAEREKRRIGRPSIVADFRKPVEKILEEKSDLPSLEILRRVREAGYQGGQDRLLRAGGLAPRQAGEAAGPLRRSSRRVQSARFWASGSGVPRRRPPADSFLRFSVEVLAVDTRQFGGGRGGGKFGAHVGRASGQLGRTPLAVCV